jgi:catechol 2,3-dioxygenase-like lactoylglutathione lyase family enzyme
MKRLHVSLAVVDLDKSVRFYSSLFAAEPTVRKPDYAKWMLDDPRVNFSLTARGAEPGLNHLGIQVEDADELREVYARLIASEGAIVEEGAVTCCYHKSEKSWAFDPQGVAWEAFLTSGESESFGETAEPRSAAAAACCGPAAAAAEPRPALQSVIVKSGADTKTCCGQAQVPQACCAEA